jgi:hypothetical protein
MTLEGKHLVLSTSISNVRRQVVLCPSVRMLLALEVDGVETPGSEVKGRPLRFMVSLGPLLGISPL